MLLRRKFCLQLKITSTTAYDRAVAQVAKQETRAQRD